MRGTPLECGSALLRRELKRSFRPRSPTRVFKAGMAAMHWERHFKSGSDLLRLRHAVVSRSNLDAAKLAVLDATTTSKADFVQLVNTQWASCKNEMTVVGFTKVDDKVTCVCGKTGCLYVFTLRNTVTGQILFPVGSECGGFFDNQDLDDELKETYDSYKLLTRVEEQLAAGKLSHPSLQYLKDNNWIGDLEKANYTTYPSMTNIVNALTRKIIDKGWFDRVNDLPMRVYELARNPNNAKTCVAVVKYWYGRNLCEIRYFWMGCKQVAPLEILNQIVPRRRTYTTQSCPRVLELWASHALYEMDHDFKSTRVKRTSKENPGDNKKPRQSKKTRKA